MLLAPSIFPLVQKLFAGKKIVLGLTGGIALVKSCELARNLLRAGAKVHPVLTSSAAKMIAPEVFSALTGQKAWLDQWQEDAAGMMAHIALSRGADAIVVAPTTANTLAKLAQGVADDLLSTLIVGRQVHCPLILAPSMNVEMWHNPATQKNVNTLASMGAHILPPESGLLACGEEGAGRLMPVEDLQWHLLRVLIAQTHPSTLRGQTILITLGSTLEKIDPVRGITNISSGEMGVSMAIAAWLLGAEVQVVAGGKVPSFLQMPTPSLTWESVESAQAMHDAVMKTINRDAKALDGFIGVAAVADYRPNQAAPQKIKKHADTLTLTLSKTIDILKAVSGHATHRPKWVMGFAAESEQVLSYAQKKLSEKKLDFIVANSVAEAFGHSTNAGYLITAGQPHTPHPLPLQAKGLMAWEVLTTAPFP